MLPLQPRQGEARQRRAGPSNTGSLPADSGRLQLMVVPSTACPARCRYCFGPHASLGVMEPGTVDAIIRFLHSDGSTRGPVEITFHGGEPLVAGRPFYEDALPRFRQGLGFRAAGFAIQSNLWLITDELCGLFREHGVSIGTSLDGPRDITDRQRGEGYFDRTMAGIEMARRHGMEPSCICTFTPESLPHYGRCFDFFVREGLPFTIHAAVPSLVHAEASRLALTPEQHGELLCGMLERYLENLQRVKIGTLDAMCRSVPGGAGGICTFTNCLGHYLAVGPDGGIFPCQRFVPLASHRMGDVHGSTLDSVRNSPAWRSLEEREERIREECGECAYFAFCKGGCPYNALAAGAGLLRDPHCAAYRRAFASISDQAVAEVFTGENLAAVVERVDQRKGLLRHGRLLSLLRPGPHPFESAGHARQIVAAAALAAEGSPEAAALRMEALGLSTNPRRTLTALNQLRDRFMARTVSFNNLYLHLTLDCNLRCTHCYARAGERSAAALGAEAAVRAAAEAARLGFRHTVLTGGEPLVHPERDKLLDALASARPAFGSMLTVLRTNLSVPVNRELLARVGAGTDQVVVSVDGDPETHDRRRGAGSHERTVANLRALVESGPAADVSIACVLPASLVQGPPGDAVRNLARELGIRRVRFRPVLPLGRALEQEHGIAPETTWGGMDPEERVERGFCPAASCGLGQNLYVEPDGSAFPCYAWRGPEWHLGSIIQDGVTGVTASALFRSLSLHNVDSNRGCRTCALRYLCGGACRAWNNLQGMTQRNLDAAPQDCAGLYLRAWQLLSAALKHLGVSEERWQQAGLRTP